MADLLMVRWAAGEALPTAHIHVRVEAVDCDGTYLRAYISRPEGLDPLDLLKATVFEYLPPSEETTLVRTAGGSFEWTERTEEGHRNVSIEPCEKECQENRHNTYDRDLTAERAGY
jgi:hypothetical protein